MKKIISAIILALFSISLPSFPSVHASQSNEKLYIAFGDSISAGYGIESKELTYPAIIAEKYALSLNNLAENGATSADMLITIANTPEIKNAELITISVGGNDLIENRNIFLAYSLRENLCQAGFTQKKAESLIKSVELPGLFNGTSISFDTIEADMERVFTNLNENLSNSIKLIRSLSENSVIILQTLYNPYLNNPEYNIFGFDVGVLIDDYIDSINSVYYALQADADMNILIADVASGMNGNSEYFYTSWDFHPTKAGHAYIAKIVGDVYGQAAQTSASPQTEQTTDTVQIQTTELTGQTEQTNSTEYKTSSPQTVINSSEVTQYKDTTMTSGQTEEETPNTEPRLSLPVILTFSAVSAVILSVCILIAIKRKK